MVQVEELNRPLQCRNELCASFGELATEGAVLCLQNQALSLWDQDSHSPAYQEMGDLSLRHLPNMSAASWLLPPSGGELPHKAGAHTLLEA